MAALPGVCPPEKCAHGSTNDNGEDVGKHKNDYANTDSIESGVSYPAHAKQMDKKETQDLSNHPRHEDLYNQEIEREVSEMLNKIHRSDENTNVEYLSGNGVSGDDPSSIKIQSKGTDPRLVQPDQSNATLAKSVLENITEAESDDNDDPNLLSNDTPIGMSTAGFDSASSAQGSRPIRVKPGPSEQTHVKASFGHAAKQVAELPSFRNRMNLAMNRGHPLPMHRSAENPCSGNVDEPVEVEPGNEATQTESSPVDNEPMIVHPVEDSLTENPPPPPYQETESGWRTAYVDFPPRCMNEGGILTKPEYEKFDVLVARANGWLSQHPELKVKSCESIELQPPLVWEGGMLDTHTTAYQYEVPSTCHLRVLRMWVIPLSQWENPNEPQQVGYLNVIPACLDIGGVKSNPKFDTLSRTIKKFNQLLQHRPLPGRVLSGEMVAARYRQWSCRLDPDLCFWYDQGYFSTSFLQVFRLYYVTGPSHPQTVGIANFVPEKFLLSGGRGSRWESLKSLTSRVGVWLQQNPDKDLANIQTMHCKLRNAEVDVERSLFNVSPLGTNQWVQALCVFYIQGSHISVPRTLSLPSFICKMFLPSPLSDGSSFVRPQFETTLRTMQRMTAWLNFNAGMELLSVETVILCATPTTDGQDSSTQYRSYGYNHADSWVYGFRVYMAGDCREPHPTLDVAAVQAVPADDDEAHTSCLIM